MAPEEYIKQFIVEMHEWETWANQLMNQADAGDIDEDYADEKIDTRFAQLSERYAIKPAEHAVQFEDPPDYHPSEEILNVKIDGNEAIVLTRQIHKEKLSKGAKDPNCEVTYELAKIDDQWKIKKRLKKDSDGDIFNVGI